MRSNIPIAERIKRFISRIYSSINKKVELTLKYAHLCSDGTIYVWQPNKPNPRACPRCKERIDAPHIKREDYSDVLFFYSPKRYEKYKDNPEFRKELKTLE